MLNLFSFSLLRLPPPPYLPSLPLFVHLPSYLSQSLIQSLTSSFNILQYFPYIDHSLLPHSTMLFTVLSCVFNIFSYLDHLELYIKVRLNTRPSYQRQQKFGRGPVVHKTRVLRGTSNPQWREDFMVRGPQ